MSKRINYIIDDIKESILKMIIIYLGLSDLAEVRIVRLS